MARETIPVLITPEMASEMLDKNYDNRSLRQDLIDRYAKEMAEGRWQHNGETLIIAPNGRVLDGQHRLYACIQAGVAFLTDIAYDVPEEVFATIDNNPGRSIGDHFNVAGVANWNVVSSMVRWIYRYTNNIIFHKRGIASPQQLLDIFHKTPDVDPALGFGRHARNRRLLSIPMACAFAWLIQQVDKERAEEFLHAFSEEEYGTGLTAVKCARQKITDFVLDDPKRLPQEDRLALLIKAWNAFYQNKVVKRVSFNHGESFPRVLGLRPKSIAHFIDDFKWETVDDEEEDE